MSTHPDLMKMISEMGNIEKCFADEESVRLYKARVEYLIYRDFHTYVKSVLEEDHTWHIRQLEKLYPSGAGEYEIIIWGYSKEAEYISSLLNRSNYNMCPTYFCDDNSLLWGKRFRVF